MLDLNFRQNHSGDEPANCIVSFVDVVDSMRQAVVYLEFFESALDSDDFGVGLHLCVVDSRGSVSLVLQGFLFLLHIDQVW